MSPQEAARRRWARVAWAYGLLLAFGVFFVGPFLMGFLASLKTNPLEWPFTLGFPQVRPKNWAAAWQLGQKGSGDPWLGGMRPGREVVLEVAYFWPEPTLRTCRPPSPGASPGRGWERSLRAPTPPTTWASSAPSLWKRGPSGWGG
jgi:multiple sugar transport system permease protein